MAKFRKKPVIIEAVQWTGKNLFEITVFIEGKQPHLLHPIAFDKWEDYKEIVKREGLLIKTLEGNMKADLKDWIIRGIQGEYYPCKPDIFKKTYEPVK